jgi:hypothetical protein
MISLGVWFLCSGVKNEWYYFEKKKKINGKQVASVWSSRKVVAR